MAQIMIVEDNQGTNKAICEYLKTAGHTLFPALDGEEALNIFRDNSIDLAVLDIMLPKMSGVTILHEIRKISNIPVVMLTAVDDEYTQSNSFDELADDYITKPFSMLILGKRITALLRRSENKSTVSTIRLGNVTVISLVFSFLFSKGITGPILSISTSVHQMSKLDRTAEITVISTDEIGGLANDINSLYQSLLVTIRNLEEEKDKVQLVEKEKIDFLRTASHELKTPVTELNATLENMILKIGEYSDYESYLPRCKEITEQLAEMIKDILNASRLQMQMEDVPVTTFSLAECVSELCEPYRLIAETNGLRFQIEIIEDMSVRLPENQLKKALSNILSNAVNYTEAERHIKVKLEKSVLSIQNECVPLSPDELQHIFEPFYRPNRARNPANGGNGLGLYIVKTILDKQGLQYCFTSMKSKTGMEFVIYF